VIYNFLTALVYPFWMDVRFPYTCRKYLGS